MIIGLHHTALVTKNLDRLSGFYVEAFHCQKIHQFEWSGSAEIDEVMGLHQSAGRVHLLQSGSQCLEIFEFAQPAWNDDSPLRSACTPGIAHLSFRVSDIEAEYERLMRLGMQFNAPPNNGSTMRLTYGRDPDGNLIEILEIVGETPFARIPFTANGLSHRDVPSK